jgi:hypothetical protein
LQIISYTKRTPGGVLVNIDTLATSIPPKGSFGQKKMHTRAAVITALLCLTSRYYAQDQIIRTDNTTLKVRIIEVGPDEIRYKLFSNPNGPTYVESRSTIGVIVYENGRREMINPGFQSPEQQMTSRPASQGPVSMSRKDSLLYFSYNQNISLNFLYFFNNELGIIFQKEFFKSNFNITIPFGFGVERPNVTNSIYFKSSAYPSFIPTKKIFEVGFGIHYYPSLRSNANFFIGPDLRYMQYDGSLVYYLPVGSGLGVTLEKLTTLSRYALSITNGFVIRTRSRLTSTIFASLGFKNDLINRPPVDPHTGLKISSLNSPVSLYFWSGFNVGFNF